eukprot:gnl/MRDRNA2_/MRDRNA2_161749_c0_seq1.p1 gnl/MRDRNA2_/MRDRNA2_161749_c0~~gnl/MRDRNA2_/MRDRNA2_161749_c0_seq1.p1  ORF type:complete len:465 (-),score=40.03 gnl/MRDRNA2_/MRDRNA2_161749_c0_seq1:31-1425(-)
MRSSSGGVMSQDFWLRERPGLRILFLMFSIEIIGSAMLIAVQAFFMIEDLKLTPFLVGTVVSATAATQMLGAPFSGRISDACGRRQILIFAFFWVGTFQIATSFVYNYISLLIVRSLIGICGGTFAISGAPVLDVEPSKEQRSMYMGLFGAITSFAFSIGPALGALLFWSELLSRRQLFLLAGCFAITSGIIGFLFFKETLPEDRRRPLCGPPKDDSTSKSVEGVGLSDLDMVNPGLSLIWTASCLADFGKFFLYSMYSFLINDLFGYQDTEFGIILMCCGLGSMVVQAFIFPATVRFIGVHATVVCSAAFTAVGLACLPLFTSVFLHFLMLAIFIVGISLWEPGVPVLLGSYASSYHLGAAMGVNFVCCRIGGITAPIIAGWLYQKFRSGSFLVGGASCALSGLMILLAFLCATEVSAAMTAKFEAKYADEAGEDISEKPKETQPLSTMTTTSRTRLTTSSSH